MPTLKIILWLVNTVAEMNGLMATGVDGVVPDYPNRLAQLSAGNNGADCFFEELTPYLHSISKPIV